MTPWRDRPQKQKDDINARKRKAWASKPREERQRISKVKNQKYMDFIRGRKMARADINQYWGSGRTNPFTYSNQIYPSSTPSPN